MQNILIRLRSEVRATFNRPSRVLELANPRKLWAHAQWLTSSDPAFEVGAWRSNAAGLNVRTYRIGTEDYLRHQRAKLPTLDLTDYDRTFHAHLSQRLNAHGLRPGTTVLCLGARLGTEVRAFLDHSCFAVGIDLNPARTTDTCCQVIFTRCSSPMAASTPCSRMPWIMRSTSGVCWAKCRAC